MLLLLLIGGGVLAGYVYLFRPPWFARFRRRARLLGYAYVAAIVISAILRLRFGWGA